MVLLLPELSDDPAFQMGKDSLTEFDHFLVIIVIHVIIIIIIIIIIIVVLLNHTIFLVISVVQRVEFEFTSRCFPAYHAEHE